MPLIATPRRDSRLPPRVETAMLDVMLSLPTPMPLDGALKDAATGNGGFLAKDVPSGPSTSDIQVYHDLEAGADRGGRPSAHHDAVRHVDRAKAQPVNDIADRAADDQADRDSEKGRPHPVQPDDQNDHHECGERGQPWNARRR